MQQRTGDDPVPLLEQLGFTEGEAQAYCAILKYPGATGYRLAQELGKAPTNIYRSLAGLVAKGAVIVEDDVAKTYGAVAPAELMSRLNREFVAKAASANAALQQLSAASEDQRIYQIRDLEQAFERAMTMLEGAREIVVFDLFPEPLGRLGEHLERTAGRGVTVAGKVYGDEVVAGVRTARHSGHLLAIWPGQQMTLIVDGTEFLLALVSRDGRSLLQGYWSTHPYLACVQHSGLAAEIVTTDRKRGRFSDIGLLTSMPPGLRTLQD